MKKLSKILVLTAVSLSLLEGSAFAANYSNTNYYPQSSGSYYNNNNDRDNDNHDDLAQRGTGSGWDYPDQWGSYGGYTSPEGRERGYQTVQESLQRGRPRYPLNQQEAQSIREYRSNNNYDYNNDMGQ